MKFYIIRLQHKVELFKGPLGIYIHIQVSCRVLRRAQQLQSQQRTILNLISLCSGGNGLAGVTDFLAVVEDSPRFLYTFGGFDAAKRDGWRRRPDLALDKQNIHPAPEKYDGNANGALNKHAATHYAKAKERPIQC